MTDSLIHPSHQMGGMAVLGLYEVQRCTGCGARADRRPSFLGYHGHDLALEQPCPATVAPAPKARKGKASP